LEDRRPPIATIEELLVGEARLTVDDSLSRSEEATCAAHELERRERCLHDPSPCEPPTISLFLDLALCFPTIIMEPAMETPFVNVPRITTPRLLLRELRLGDFDGYVEHMTDPVATEWMTPLPDRRTAWRL